MNDCCILHKKAHAKMSTFIKTLHATVGGNPRNWLMIYERLRTKLSAEALAAALSKECPCQKGLTEDDISIIEHATFEEKNKLNTEQARKRFDAEMKIPTSPTRLASELNMERLKHLANGAL